VGKLLETLELEIVALLGCPKCKSSLIAIVLSAPIVEAKPANRRSTSASGFSSPRRPRNSLRNGYFHMQKLAGILFLRTLPENRALSQREGHYAEILNTSKQEP
jgi:hypothetical protein